VCLLSMTLSQGQVQNYDYTDFSYKFDSAPQRCYVEGDYWGGGWVCLCNKMVIEMDKIIP